jgi:hypothetical protein
MGSTENDLRLNDSTDVLHVPNVFGADDADLNLFQPACFSFYAYMPIPILTVAREVNSALHSYLQNIFKYKPSVTTLGPCR